MHTCNESDFQVIDEFTIEGVVGEMNCDDNDVNQNSNKTYKNPELVNLIKKAIGSRSIVRFAELSGLSTSFLSRLLNNNLPSRPSKRSLCKMAKVEFENGVTLDKIFEVAGYIEGEERGTMRLFSSLGGIGKTETVPQYARTVTYPMSLLVNTLAQQNRFDMQFDISVQPGLFEVKIKTRNEMIVGLSAICEAEKEKASFSALQLSLIMAINMYNQQLKDKCFVIITNQETIYNTFGNGLQFPNDMKLCVVLTNDYHSFCKERWVESECLNEGGSDKEKTYQFVLPCNELNSDQTKIE